MQVQAMNEHVSETQEPLAMSDELIRENLEKLRAILNTAADAIVTINHDGVITAANPATVKLFGYSEDEMVGQNVCLLMPEPHHSEHGGYLRRYLQTGEARIIGKRRELTARRKDGSVFPIELSVSEFQDGAGPMFTGIIHDISHRRALERRLADVRIEEQHRISQELHDGLGGQLTGVGLLVKALRNRLHAEGSPYAAEVDELAKHIEKAHAQVRIISRGLSPVEMLPDGLAKSLNNLAEQTDQSDDIRCTFRTDGTVVHKAVVAAHLFRIAQEAVSNAVRHGHPSTIDICLEHVHDHTVLTIRNDGRSFKHFTDSERGMGIHTMKHRASVIGGELWITPGEGGGTVVVCRAPNMEASDGKTC